ncbi:MAG: GNAT family N-acetyltransferase [Candidatus Aenigmarchaeota archaeon]|nr:GNAT family N-acetyltransferase [Candidatus Aenigmarchaeota archaeon]
MVPRLPKTRPAKTSDYDFIRTLTKETLFPYISKYHKIDKKVFDKGFRERLKSLQILLEEETPIGTLQLSENGSDLEVVEILISPMYQKKGLGKQIMSYLETLGYEKICLEVWDNNPAIDFYRTLGYKEVGSKKHKIFMEKRID